MSRLMSKLSIAVLLVIFGTLLYAGFQETRHCGDRTLYSVTAIAQAAPLVDLGDSFALCAELGRWSDRITALHQQLHSKHTAANEASEDCSTYEARETIRSLFSQAATLFEELLNEVESFVDRYAATLGLLDTIADTVQEAAAMCADYQIGVQYMIDMTYAYAKEDTSQGLALGETGAEYCNQALTVDDILLVIHDTIDTALCQEPSIELISPVTGALVEGPLVLFEWSAVDSASSYMLTIWQLPESVPDQVDVSDEIPEDFFDVVYEIAIPGKPGVSPAATEYEIELLPGVSYAWQVFSFLDEELIELSDCGFFTCESEPEDISLRFSGHLAAGEGTCQQITDSKISCHVSPGSPVILELEAMVSPPEYAVALDAWNLPSWVSFESASDVGSVSTQVMINGPDVAAGFHDPTVTLVFTATTVDKLQAQLEVELVLNQPVPSGYGDLTFVLFDVPAGEETDQGVEFDIPFLPDFSAFVLEGVTNCETGGPINALDLSTQFVFSAYAEPPYQLADLETVTVNSPGYLPFEITQFQPSSITLLMPTEPDFCLIPNPSALVEPASEVAIGAPGSDELWGTADDAVCIHVPDAQFQVELLAPENGISVAAIESVFEWDVIAPSAPSPTELHRLLIWELPELMPGLEPFFSIDYEFSACELGSPVPSRDLKEGYVDQAIELERQYIDKYSKLKNEYERDLGELEEEWEKDTQEWGEEDAWMMFLENVADLNRRYNGYLRALAESFFNDFCRLEDDYSPEYKEYFTRRFFGYPDDLLYVPPPPGYAYLEEEEIPYLLSVVSQFSDSLNDVWVPFHESLWSQRYEEHPITEADILAQTPIVIIEVADRTSCPIPDLHGHTWCAWQVQILRQTRLGICEVIGVSDMQSFTVSDTSEDDDDDEECEVRYVQVRLSNVWSEPDELTGDILDTVPYEGEVEVIECDEDETWWKVKLPNGKVGWMLQSHLVPDKRPIVEGTVREGPALTDEEEIGAGIKG